MPEPADLGMPLMAPYIPPKPEPTVNEIKLSSLKATWNKVAGNLSYDIHFKSIPVNPGGVQPPTQRTGFLMNDDELAATQLAAVDIFLRAMLKISQQEMHSMTPQVRLKIWLATFKREITEFEAALTAECNRRQIAFDKQQALLKSHRRGPSATRT